MSASSPGLRKAFNPAASDDGDALHFCTTCAFSQACLSQGYAKSDLADLHVLVDHAEGTHLHVLGEAGAGVNHCHGMDRR